MSSQNDRATLRKTLRERRRSLPAPQRIAAANTLADRLLALPLFLQDPLPTGYVAGYWAMDGEIGLHAFQLRLPKGLIYCLPLLHADGCLRFAPWRSGDPLVSNRYGIPEPDVSADGALRAEDMAMIVLPLTGFDADCNRLGMGGGWYDRTLAFRKAAGPTPLLVGVGFAVQRVDALPREDWDVPLDAVCCEDATYLAKEPA